MRSRRSPDAPLFAIALSDFPQQMRFEDAPADGPGARLQGTKGLDHLFPRFYAELQRLARGQLRRERTGHTLNTTDLVHEAYLKLTALERIEAQNRAHLLALAGQAMRRVLVDHAVHRNAAKRGGKRVRVTLGDVAEVGDDDGIESIELEEALRRLESINARHGRIVECRFFAGMTVEETAAALDISPATVYREWNMARAWLNRELST
ncbi:MAG: ECF-type sigma factor [Longimicrobiales bacterium]